MIRSIFIAGLFALSTASVARSDDSIRPSKPDPSAKAAAELRAAYTMARLGRESKSPELLLAAARVIGTTNTMKLDVKEAKTNSKEQEDDVLAEVTGLIKEAKGLAGDNAAVKTLADLIEKDVKEFKRGAEGGPKKHVGSYGQDCFGLNNDYYCVFNEKQLACIDVYNASGRGDLELYVYDPNGKLVAQDRRNDEDCSVAFHVDKRAKYRIVIKFFNGKREPTKLKLVTN
ncbi:MAG: hypothetical protein K8T89_05140 [Planctomycetes bacterium]|nr:hypothetical protein [Planctomycetota bacterium]